ncbi:MAG TPA: YqaJ viral recombinase family protein [Chitinophagales bacterium]|nr:YqaJ viral recombinase family protein [Chitinophagales bacterium]
MNQEQKDTRSGKFTASRASDLLVAGTGATRLSYIYDVAASMFGCLEPFDNAHTRHGVTNQHDAFISVVKPNFKNAIWYDQYKAINDNAGASPDAYVEEGIPLDVKCPTSIDSYSSEVHKYSNVITSKTNAGYFVQVQVQMLTTNAPYGYLLFYLTKFRSYMETDWTEYIMPLAHRYTLIKFDRNEELQDTWLKAVDEAVIRRDRIAELMANAKVMDEFEYFYIQTKHNKLFRAKNAPNHLSIKYIRVGNRFYYER